jgi:hypothetical protein
MSCNCDNPNVHRCNNPCRVSTTNTPACESLPSQIENFSIQFFGTVEKTEIDGKVTWMLPCSLDVGLPENPRAVDEGLACYLLRLFADGIVGLTGPKGDPGTPGAPGNNTYTVTLHSFTQPTAGNPNVAVITAFNPTLFAGQYVFVQGSGWYLVTLTDGAGTLFLTLAEAAPSAPAAIPAGKLVVPTGPPGASVTGPQGPQGPVGPQGIPGEIVTLNHGYYYAPVGTDYVVGAVYAAVDFVNSAPSVVLPKAGTYLVTAAVSVAGSGGITDPDAVLVKRVNTSTALDVPGTEQTLSNIQNNQFSQVICQALVTTTVDSQTVALYARATSATVFDIIAIRTSVTFVRVE